MIPKQSAPENRLTIVQTEALMRLASQMSIEIKPVVRGREFVLELSGDGFSGPEPLTLPLSSAYARLLAEVCSGLAPWIQFSPAEACEVTLFGMSNDALNTAIRKYQYRLAMRLTTKSYDERRPRTAGRPRSVGRTGCRLFSSSNAQSTAPEAAGAAVSVADWPKRENPRPKPGMDEDKNFSVA